MHFIPVLKGEVKDEEVCGTKKRTGKGGEELATMRGSEGILHTDCTIHFLDVSTHLYKRVCPSVRPLGVF